MDAHEQLTQGIARVNQALLSVLQAAKAITGSSENSFAEWEKTCTALPAQLAEGIVRVAVVGPIKSGKSTFLNSLLGGDYLKRGAGVVTSIVTRVRSGDDLKAVLYFKSWPEVNADMEQALVLFPSAVAVGRSEGPGGFDIRRSDARDALRLALESLTPEQCIAEDARNRNLVLLSCYLGGYETARGFLQEPNGSRQYDRGNFGRHWDFTGDETLAVYLKDIQLSINGGRIGRHVEIADCQGSDSSNPLHLAMIQDYLRQAHLLLYVISSRTGVRRADIKFLSMIRKMGIIDNILFVLNCDFNEHRSGEELDTLVQKVTRELAMIKPRPAVFTFSALFNLLRSPQMRPTERENRRLEQWAAESELTEFSERETRRFADAFQQWLGEKRQTLLFQNPIDRLNVIAGGLSQWIELSREILNRDADGARQIAERIHRHQQRFGQLLAALRSALSGCLPKLQKELGAEVNRFFDTGSGDLVKRIDAFIAGYRFAPEAYADTLGAGGFSPALYQLFQEYKQALDGFLTEQVNPDIIRFTAEREKAIAEGLRAMAEPYGDLMKDAYLEFCRMIGELGNRAGDGRHAAAPAMPRCEELLHNTGLSHPPLASAMRYTARIRTEAILRLGFYRVIAQFKKALKKPVTPGEEKLRALQEGMSRIKTETRASLQFLLRDYQENLKFKYLYRLADVVAERLLAAVAQQIQLYAADFGALAEVVGLGQKEKAQAADALAEMDRRCREAAESIRGIREALNAR
jgi:GTPase SAR1 family protein